jgi:Domain of unknown function (DUF4396)
MSQVSHMSHPPSRIERNGEAHVAPAQPVGSRPHGHHAEDGWHGAAMVTLHCLTGCLIGEWMGLAIGVALSLPRGVTIVLATVLAYASGFGLTMWPLLRRGMALWAALSTVFIGEAVSIGAMEVAMNTVDYAMGGMGVKNLFVARYWEALAIASVAGFLTAWPVNFWLLGRHMKKCH